VSCCFYAFEKLQSATTDSLGSQRIQQTVAINENVEGELKN
jgi:hypothetical protein